MYSIKVILICLVIMILLIFSKFMENVGPILSDAARNSGVSASQIAKEAFSGNDINLNTFPFK